LADHHDNVTGFIALTLLSMLADKKKQAEKKKARSFRAGWED